MKQNKAYPAWEPTTLTGIKKPFMHQFFTVNLNNGTLTIEDVEEFRGWVKEAHEKNPTKPQTAYAEYRRKFATKYYNHLVAKKEVNESDEEFFASKKKKKKPVKKEPVETTENKQ